MISHTSIISLGGLRDLLSTMICPVCWCAPLELLQSAENPKKKGSKRAAVKRALQGKIESWQPQNATFVLAPGASRMLVLEAPPKAKYKVSRQAPDHSLP
jgi:hypothetical protein